MSEIESTPAPLPPAPVEGQARVGIRWFLSWCAIALVVRLLPTAAIFSEKWQALRGIEGGALPVGTDALYHLRRIQEIVLDFPNIPTFDPYLKYPDGALIPYEPGLDLLLAWLARLFGGPTPSAAFVERVAALSIPFLGLLMVPLYTIATIQLFGHRAGRFAMPFLAVLPGCVVFASTGQVDHHVLEPLTFVLPIIPLLSAIKRSDFSPQPNTVLTLTVSSGVLLGTSFLFWRGAIIPATLIAGYLGLRTIERSIQSRLGGFDLWGGPLVLGTAAALATPFCVAHPMGLAGEISYFTPSWFQPLYLMVLALGLMTLSAGIAFLGTSISRSRQWTYLVAFPSGLAPLFALSLVSPSFLENLLKGLGFVSRKDGFVKAVAEQLMLFVDFNGDPNFLLALTLYGLLLPLCPLAALSLYRRQKARGGSLFWLWLLGVLAMGIMQRRYAVLLSPVLAILIGASAANAFHRARTLMSRPMVYMLYLLSFMHSTYVLAQTVDIVPQRPETLELAHWLRHHTPNTPDFHLKAGGSDIAVTKSLTEGEGETPSTTPVDDGYGIVANWTLGHHLVYLAQRPAISNPFGIEWFKDGVEATAKFLLSKYPARHMETLGAHYAVVGFGLLSLRQQAELAGLNPDDYARKSGGEWVPGPKYWDIAATRLYFKDGLATQNQEATPNLRLIFETQIQEKAASARALIDGEISALKVFEWVPMAQVVGIGPSHCTASATMDIETNLGRHFQWQAQAQCDANGHFSIRVPYANLDTKVNRTWGKSPLIVDVSNPNSPDAEPWRAVADIFDNKVRNGETIQLQWQNAVLQSPLEIENDDDEAVDPLDNPSGIGPKP